jgi:putative ABC transport system permease protein
VRTTEAPAGGRLRPADLARLATVGLRTRRLRAALSALGITIGVAAIVAVLGLSASSQAGLLAEISALGTNLLTVTNGQDLNGGIAELPEAAPPMIARLPGVTAVTGTAVTGTGATSASAYRTPLIPAINTNALTVSAASAGLPAAVGTSVAQGTYLNAATARQPVAVLGAAAAQLLGIDRVWPGERIWVGGMWFYVTGILRPAPLAPQIDVSVLVGYPAAGITSASTAAPPPPMSGPRPARSPPSITCSPGRPTPRNPRT